MNPFVVRKIITESKRNGERLVIEELSRRCGVRLRHFHLRMSEEMFEHEPSGGFPRHWIKGLRPLSYITLWNYKPPKETDFSPENQTVPLPTFGEMKSLEDVEK